MPRREYRSFSLFASGSTFCVHHLWTQGTLMPASESWRDLLGRESNLPDKPLVSLDVPVRERFAQVELTRVVPSWDLPWVLALDDRVGFQPADAEAFQARGCRDTLQAIAREFRRRATPSSTPSPHVRRAVDFLGGGALADLAREGAGLVGQQLHGAHDPAALLVPLRIGCADRPQQAAQVELPVGLPTVVELLLE